MNTNIGTDEGCRECTHRKKMLADRICGFCGKPHTEIQFLVAGPMIFICNECVDLSCGIIAQGWKDKADRLEEARKKDEEVGNAE